MVGLSLRPECRSGQPAQGGCDRRPKTDVAPLLNARSRSESVEDAAKAAETLGASHRSGGARRAARCARVGPAARGRRASRSPRSRCIPRRPMSRRSRAMRVTTTRPCAARRSRALAMYPDPAARKLAIVAGLHDQARRRCAAAAAARRGEGPRSRGDRAAVRCCSRAARSRRRAALAALRRRRPRAQASAISSARCPIRSLAQCLGVILKRSGLRSRHRARRGRARDRQDPGPVRGRPRSPITSTRRRRIRRASRARRPQKMVEARIGGGGK